MCQRTPRPIHYNRFHRPLVERGVVLLLAPDMKQAKVLLDYTEGTLESAPIMKQLLAGRTAETLTLTTGITLEVRSASFRRIRGVTCVAVLADECAFWMSDESANPDVEILNAARPLWQPPKDC